MSAITDAALQAAPADKARGYWATVGRSDRARQGQHGLRVHSGCDFYRRRAGAVARAGGSLSGLDDPAASPYRTPGYPLGTDELGRDMLARLIYGGRLSLIVGILPVILAFLIGTSLGLVAGYVGGKINTAIMRTVDVFYAFPSVLLAIAIRARSAPASSIPSCR